MERISMNTFEVRNLNLFYGKNQALKNISIDIRKEQGNGIHRTVRLRKIYIHKVLQQDERPY